MGHKKIEKYEVVIHYRNHTGSKKQNKFYRNTEIGVIETLINYMRENLWTDLYGTYVIDSYQINFIYDASNQTVTKEG